MEVCHDESAVFDDPNLVSCAGLGPVVALAEQCGLPQLVAAQLTLPAKAGVNAHLKVPALVGATVSSPLAAPVIVATRLRKGSTNSARGAPGWSPTRWRPRRRPGLAGRTVMVWWCCGPTRRSIATMWSRRPAAPPDHHRGY